MVEKCRSACGGHGYMVSSNLPQTYGLAAAAYTYEGEFTVLMLQTARLAKVELLFDISVISFARKQFFVITYYYKVFWIFKNSIILFFYVYIL